MAPRSTRNEESARMDGELLRYAVVVSRDGAKCVVSIGDLESGPLPWLAPRAGKTRVWSPPSPGEQVVLLCPEGDIEAGVVLCGVYSDDFPAPSEDEADRIEFDDGTVISYDAETHELRAILAAGGKAHIEAPGGVTIIGDVEITGDITLTGKMTASDDVIAAGKSLKTHKHGGVQAGGAQTGTPV